jgi:hypothetical protein
MNNNKRKESEHESNEQSIKRIKSISDDLLDKILEECDSFWGETSNELLNKLDEEKKKTDQQVIDETCKKINHALKTNIIDPPLTTTGHRGIDHNRIYKEHKVWIYNKKSDINEKGQPLIKIYVLMCLYHDDPNIISIEKNGNCEQALNQKMKQLLYKETDLITQIITEHLEYQLINKVSLIKYKQDHFSRIDLTFRCKSVNFPSLFDLCHKALKQNFCPLTVIKYLPNNLISKMFTIQWTDPFKQNIDSSESSESSETSESTNNSSNENSTLDSDE